MVDINLPNFITIGLMAAVATALLTWLMSITGFNIPWLSGN